MSLVNGERVRVFFTGKNLLLGVVEENGDHGFVSFLTIVVDSSQSSGLFFSNINQTFFLCLNPTNYIKK